MITDRELFEQALEALDVWLNSDKWIWSSSARETAVNRTSELIAALRERLARPEAEPWKQAIDDELVTLQSTADSFATPRQAIKALIDWHCSVSLDPQVSSSAAELIEQGKRLAQERMR